MEHDTLADKILIEQLRQTISASHKRLGIDLIGAN